MKHTHIEDSFYKTGILLFLGMIFFIAIKAAFPQALSSKPCMFHLLTGYYCPGCGGTRAVYALTQGRLLLSAFYHPLVPYGAGVYLAFMISQTVSRICRKPQLGMKFHMCYVWIALTLLFLNFALKNLLHFAAGFVL